SSDLSITTTFGILMAALSVIAYMAVGQSAIRFSNAETEAIRQLTMTLFLAGLGANLGWCLAVLGMYGRAFVRRIRRLR
ncbi:MAG: hypothetical protein K2X45_19440, partial [Phreatobacter sp.]|nr:hypothetical protein [Phreatobacter sp.]